MIISSSSSTDQQQCSSSSSVWSTAPPCCSSSSSDEAEADIRGWPSVANVLETPDRRRMRKNWRSVPIRVDLNRISEPVHHRSSVINIHRSLPAIISRRQCSTFSPSNRKNGTKRLVDTAADNSVYCSPNNSKTARAVFTSPPLMRQLRHSPILRTPKSDNNLQPTHVHLSGSPMSAFFIRQRLSAAEDDPSSEYSPKSSSATLSVLRPLNIQNYIGIRFSGEHSSNVTRSQPLNSNYKNGAAVAGPSGKMPSSTSSTIAVDENSFVVPKCHNKQTTRYSSPSSSTSFKSTNDGDRANCSANNDSGFLDASAASSAAETPSKGLLLFTPLHPCDSSALLDHFDNAHQQIQHGTQSNCTASSSSSFNTAASAISEQSYGPLEASVLDGILNDLSQWPSMDAKTSGEMRVSPQRCSLLFERRLSELESGRGNEKSMGKMRGEEFQPDAITMDGIPSELILEMEQMAEEVTFEELGMLLPDLDEHALQRMFGLSSDQCELTQMAHSFVQLHCSQRFSSYAIPINSTLSRDIRCIGLLNDERVAQRVKLD